MSRSNDNEKYLGELGEILFRHVQRNFPHELRQIISYYHLKNIDEYIRWCDDVTDKVCEYAIEKLPKSDTAPFQEDRRICPLCGNGPSSPFDKGFTVNEGLTRHLTGSHNVHECIIMRCLRFKAIEHVREEERKIKLTEEEIVDRVVNKTLRHINKQSRINI